ncbi:MAG: hypothetical protein BWY85_01930 [Firmicutes bacterium ADurb.Bin506]|nr:MAG: hypothetical protein BWY85_01930 [Firmicutes bacterium ADurb.Bin506]
MTGILVAPPTRMTSLMSLTESFASRSAWLKGPVHLWVRSLVSSSNLALVSFISRCLGPVWSAVMNGRLMLVSNTDDSSILAFSAASISLCSAWRSRLRSMPCSRRNSPAM